MCRSGVGGPPLAPGARRGAEVAAGDVLARILPSDPSLLDARSRAELRASAGSAEAALALARAELERAEAQLEFAAMEADRLSQLRERSLISIEDYDRAELALRVAAAARETAIESTRVREAELAAAEARLVETGSDRTDDIVVTVRAPTSGRIMRVAQESQSVILGGAEILTLGDPRDIEVVAEFLSTDAVEIEPGAVAFIEIDVAPIVAAQNQVIETVRHVDSGWACHSIAPGPSASRVLDGPEAIR